MDSSSVSFQTSSDEVSVPSVHIALASPSDTQKTTDIRIPECSPRTFEKSATFGVLAWTSFFIVALLFGSALVAQTTTPSSSLLPASLVNPLNAWVSAVGSSSALKTLHTLHALPRKLLVAGKLSAAEVKGFKRTNANRMQQAKVVKPCKQGKALVLRASMSCAIILSTYYKRSTPMYVKYNGGSPCQGQVPLVKGTQLCIP